MLHRVLPPPFTSTVPFRFDIGLTVFLSAFQVQGELLKTTVDKEALALDYTETLRGLTGYHEKQGHYSVALRVSDEGIQNIETLLGTDHASLVEALHEQSTVLGRTGNLLLAKAVAQRGLDLAEKSFGPNSVQASHCVMGTFHYPLCPSALDDSLLHAQQLLASSILSWTPSFDFLDLSTNPDCSTWSSLQET